MQNLKFITDSMDAIEAEDIRLCEEIEELDSLIQDLEDKISELFNRKSSKLDQMEKNASIYCGLEELLNKVREEV